MTPQASLAWAAAVNEFRLDLRARHYKHFTVRDYCEDATNLAGLVDEGIEPDTLTKEDVARAMTRLHEANPPLSISTLRRRRSAFVLFAEFCLGRHTGLPRGQVAKAFRGYCAHLSKDDAKLVRWVLAGIHTKHIARRLGITQRSVYARFRRLCEHIGFVGLIPKHLHRDMVGSAP